MTPNDLLQEVLGHFSLLLADDATQHAAMLKSAIETFQNRAGYRKEVKIDAAAEYALPDDFLSLSIITDSYQTAVFSSPYRKLGDKKQYISFGTEESYPLTMTYFVKLSQIDFAVDELPSESLELISEHLRIQIEIANNERIRRVEDTANADTSSIPSESEKRAELQVIEERMTNEFSFVGILAL